MSRITEITTCRLCDCALLIKVLPLRPTPVGDLYIPAERHPENLESLPLDVYQCKGCGHVQLKAAVDPEYLYSEYIYTTSSSLGLADHFKAYAATVCKKLGLAQNSHIVEMGSNDGTMLRAFKEEGMRVTGVDPARDIAQKATESGIPTINDFFSVALAKRIAQECGPCDLFIANNVLANVPSPKEIFLGILELLSPVGVIVFETGYLRYLAEDCVFDNIYHEHIDYYSIRPLVKFFENIGLELFDVDVSDSKGSSIRCYVQRNSGQRVVSNIVPELCLREEKAGYDTPKPYDLLGKKLEATKRSLHEILLPLKAAGKIIAGFGASVGVTTVLYHFELDGILDYLLDDNAARQGLFSPGLALQVRSPEVLYGSTPPDVILILAWRYADPIMAKHSNFLSGGGRFLLMLPEVRVIK